MNVIKKTVLGTALAASALAATTPAMARDYYHRSHDNSAAVAIGAGVIGLALGAAIASSSNDHDRYRERYYDNTYSYGPAYTQGWYYRDGWYWDRDGRRHHRDEYYRHHRNNGWGHGYDHDRGDWRRGF